MGDAFAAFGRDDQKLYTMPSLDLVVARLGDATQSDATALSHFDAQFLGLTRESFEQKSQKSSLEIAGQCLAEQRHIQPVKVKLDIS